MDVKETIEKRRAYRSLAPAEITEELLADLVGCASLAPSCMNKQPWRFVAACDEATLAPLLAALPEGNAWAKKASAVIVVCSKKEFDCVMSGREYYMFDTGMATAFLILRAVELGFVAHPIAGYDYNAVKAAIGAPDDVSAITLIIIGKKTDDLDSSLSAKQIEGETARPPRMPLENILFRGKYAESKE